MSETRAVPRDPTTVMIAAGQAAMNEQLGAPTYFARGAYRAFWQAAYDAAPASPATAADDAMRKAFEAWAIAGELRIERNAHFDDEYASEWTQTGWLAWQESARAQAAEMAALKAVPADADHDDIERKLVDFGLHLESHDRKKAADAIRSLRQQLARKTE